MEKKDWEKETKGSTMISESVMGYVVFGPSDIPPLRYRCPEHGVFLGTEILWKRDERPYCPTCGQPVEELADEG